MRDVRAGMDGVRSRLARSVRVAGHSSSPGVKPAARTSTTTSFSAACGSGRSASAMPATPSARSLTVIA
ncbi:hypothetical protein [Leifsonia sp. 2MCAF36]|uniref:hypothetical protein n=1 Tax=Leifsonia sp. 2MCAF36 TaxID=3232988 RepID=UPI003F94D662